MNSRESVDFGQLDRRENGRDDVSGPPGPFRISGRLSFHSFKQRNSVEVRVPRQKNGTVLESRSGYPDVVGGDRCPLPSEESNQVAVTPRDSVFDRNESYTTLSQEESELVLVFRSPYSTGESGVQLTENNGRYDYLIGALE